jgi:hypothetical protein
MVKEVIDSAKVAVGEAKEAADSDQELTEAEARQLGQAAVAYALFTPSVYPEALVRVGIVDRFDAGLKISSTLVKPELKFQYLDIGDKLDASVFMGYAYHFGVGPSAAEKVYDIFETLKLVDYSRHDLDFGLLFGREWGQIASLYGGPRYLLSFTNVELRLKNIERVSGDEAPSLEARTPMHHVGAVVGVMVGYKYVFVNLELTLLYCIFKPKMLGEAVNLSGMIISPTLGLTARF